MSDGNSVLPDTLKVLQKRLVFVLLFLVLVAALLLQIGDVLNLGFDAPLWPSLIILLFVLSGFRALQQERLQLAVGTVNACFFVAAAVPVLLSGITNIAAGLTMFFVPVALAGIMQDRLRLLATVTGSILIVLLSVLLHNADLLGPPDGPESTLVWFAAVVFTLAISLVALVLDRFSRSTKQALADSLAREKELRSLMLEHHQVNSELSDERNFSKAVIDNLPGVFFVMDPDGEVIRGNQFILEATGYDLDELRTLPLKDFVPPEQIALVLGKIREIERSGRAVVNLDLRARDGRLTPYLFHGGSFMMQDRPYVVVLGFDISVQIEAQRDIELLNQQLESQVGRLTALIEVDAALTEGFHSTDTMQVLLKQVTERLGVDAASVLHFERETELLKWQSGTGFSSSNLQATELELGEGLAGQAASERSAQYVFDQVELRQKYQRWWMIEDEDIHFYVAVPLVAKGELEGVLELFHRSPLNPDADWRDFLTALATQAALVFNTTRLLTVLENTNRELRNAYDATIEGWSLALDLRDHETEGHSHRVTDLTVELARRMGASEERIVQIRRGALLHDIGKMGVPDSILLKPGKLTDQERRIMEQHTTYAFEMLSPVEFLKPALDIPYSHHENWDGSGYPQGLKGTDIPLAARAFSVVDVYDALRSDRPYRKAWSEEEAIGFITDQSGRRFDPEVVIHFLEMLAERND